MTIDLMIKMAHAMAATGRLDEAEETSLRSGLERAASHRIRSTDLVNSHDALNMSTVSLSSAGQLPLRQLSQEELAKEQLIEGDDSTKCHLSRRDGSPSLSWENKQNMKMEGTRASHSPPRHDEPVAKRNDSFTD
ncbi:unnamed protein product [Notodromas monacha]|uniref:Uncharacterized protein n=1 Tax=Notodromas monacha TaxID=399045 RepID=A0A7R9BIT4_9CRUS|nr:unnamed protein product [Notodromas monacha]CAG0916296.1 unnamed protein product [Notodromas monacha]